MKNYIAHIFLLLYLFTLVIIDSKGQTISPDTLQGPSGSGVLQTKPLSVSGFIDAYYSYDFGQPDLHERPGFIYNHKRANEFNINLALLKFAYTSDKVRGNLGVMAGTYAEYNLAAEQDLLKNIYEANAGFKIGKKIWLDAGIFPSHIGAETAISGENLNLTRSIGADNTPYYETGVKLTFQASAKLALTGLVLNGWQNIRENNSNKALGMQLQYKLSDKIQFNYSNFIGNEKPDSASQLRVFHNVHLSANLSDKWRLIACFDLGTEEKPKGSGSTNNWWNPTLSLHYQLTPKVSMAARTEYYHDKNGVIIATGTKNGFQTAGYSFNLDFAPTGQVLWRAEARVFDSKDGLFFNKNGSATDKNIALTSSLSLAF